jgi:uncharacterized protein YndB with AHSA1/START domain
MKQLLFTADNNIIYLEREFDAPLKVVWRAFTDAEILEQWWAPLPYKAITKSMNFTEGGKWHYYMLSPEGEKHWCMVNYLEIIVLRKYKAEDAFCDEAGNVNKELPCGVFTNEFSTTPTGSKVNMTITYPTKEDVQRIIEMGMKDGITMTLQQLDELFKNSKVTTD